MATTKRRLTEEQRDLVVRHLDFAVWVSKATVRKFPGQSEEIHDVARLELCEAAARFDPALGFRFTTYADRRIRWALCSWVKEQLLHAGRGGEVEDDDLDPLSQAAARGGDGAELCALIRSICPPREADALILLVVDGLGARLAARRLGTSPGNVSNWKRRAAARIRDRFGVAALKPARTYVRPKAIRISPEGN